MTPAQDTNVQDTSELDKSLARRLLPYGALALAALCWAGIWIAGRGIYQEMTPIAMSFWRWVIAAVVFLPFATPGLWAEREIVKQEWWRLCVFAAVSVPLFSILVYWGLHTTSAISGALFNSAQPIYVILIAWVFFSMRSNMSQIIGVAISMAGLLAIISRGSWETLASFQFSFGDILVIASSIAWAVYTVLLKAWPTALSQKSFLAMLMIIGTLMLVPFYVVDVALVGWTDISFNVIAGTVYPGIFGSILAFLCWNYGIMHSGATVGSLFIHLVPLFTAVLAIVLLGETIELFHFVGIALILAGIYCATVGKSARKAKAE